MEGGGEEIMRGDASRWWLEEWDFLLWDRGGAALRWGKETDEAEWSEEPLGLRMGISVTV